MAKSENGTINRKSLENVYMYKVNLFIKSWANGMRQQHITVTNYEGNCIEVYLHSTKLIIIYRAYERASTWYESRLPL